ncbi:MAG TPA: L,D-transpeptidase [Solirubrobacteraceae bacterium]|nr:L,D-transpeptidase [Solirubrobacteraceae bacterium]
MAARSVRLSQPGFDQGAPTKFRFVAAAALLAMALLLGAGAPRAQATPRPPALRLTGAFPEGTAPGDATIVLRFSTGLAPITARSEPRLSPAATGTWSQPNPTTLRFIPTGAYLPGTVVHITVPKTLTAVDGSALRQADTASFQVGSGSVVRLTQLLAELRYLPVHVVSAQQPAPRDTPAQLRAIFQPPAVKLALGAQWPTELRALWSGDSATVLRGAIMAFESQHGLAMDGVPSTALWQALLTARARRQWNTGGYTYAVASENSPETLTLYHNGHVVLSTPANTGIPGQGTATGTFPVYERLRSQTMQGTNPDGSHYADFVQFVAYFNGGDAVHYMPRADYGSPQSLGCVELPYSAAEQAWGYLTYGTLVTVLP